MKNYTAGQITLHTIITDGKDAVANVEMAVGNKVYAFCDVYRFKCTTSRLIADMQSYVIQTKG